ncbi:hypothetical protein Tsp_05251 [Trichinella spiralis]|uniref:hypothetical protein n=1 Tax=Trichinella spiralis TaxID=6334 RepID=UPI0001EFEAC5|nr:hypothetical protein Tsp_05251 [Trichinella spiralis]
MTYRLIISDIGEVSLSNFLTDDLHIDYYEDDILKTKYCIQNVEQFPMICYSRQFHDLNCRLLLNSTCSPEYQWQLNAEYAVEMKYCKYSHLHSNELPKYSKLSEVLNLVLNVTTGDHI